MWGDGRPRVQFQAPMLPRLGEAVAAGGAWSGPRAEEVTRGGRMEQEDRGRGPRLQQARASLSGREVSAGEKEGGRGQCGEGTMGAEGNRAPRGCIHRGWTDKMRSPRSPL